MKLLTLGLCTGLVLGFASPLVVAEAPAAAAAESGAPVLVPPEVVAEMNDLVEKAIQPASGPLQTADEFEPYAVLKKSDGSFQLVRWAKPNPPPQNMPPAMEIFRRVTLTVVEAAAKTPDIIAAVTVAPTSVPTTDGKQRVNGIRAEVDHRRGAPQIVFIPYGREDGKLVIGTPVYTPGTNKLFLQDEAVKAAEKAAKPVVKPAAKAAAKPAAKTPAKPAAKPAPAK